MTVVQRQTDEEKKAKIQKTDRHRQEGYNHKCRFQVEKNFDEMAILSFLLSEYFKRKDKRLDD